MGSKLNDRDSLKCLLCKLGKDGSLTSLMSFQQYCSNLYKQNKLKFFFFPGTLYSLSRSLPKHRYFRTAIRCTCVSKFLTNETTEFIFKGKHTTIYQLRIYLPSHCERKFIGELDITRNLKMSNLKMNVEHYICR